MTEYDPTPGAPDTPQIGIINVADRVGAFAGLTTLPAYALPDGVEDTFNELLAAGATSGDVTLVPGYALLIAVEADTDGNRRFAIVTNPIMAG